jgi:hypothetical protein
MSNYLEASKVLDIGTANERERVIKWLETQYDEQSNELLKKIASDSHEYPHIQIAATSILNTRGIVQTRKGDSQSDRPSSQTSILANLKKDPDADFILYYLKVMYNERSFYKVGVTTSSVEARYRDDFKKITTVLFEERVVGARKAEREIIQEFRDHLFPLAIFRDGNGYSEFFDKDVLELDI